MKKRVILPCMFFSLCKFAMSVVQNNEDNNDPFRITDEINVVEYAYRQREVFSLNLKSFSTLNQRVEGEDHYIVIGPVGAGKSTLLDGLLNLPMWIDELVENRQPIIKLNTEADVGFDIASSQQSQTHYIKCARTRVVNNRVIYYWDVPGIDDDQDIAYYANFMTLSTFLNSLHQTNRRIKFISVCSEEDWNGSRFGPNLNYMNPDYPVVKLLHTIKGFYNNLTAGHQLTISDFCSSLTICITKTLPTNPQATLATLKSFFKLSDNDTLRPSLEPLLTRLRDYGMFVLIPRPLQAGEWNLNDLYIDNSQGYVIEGGNRNDLLNILGRGIERSISERRMTLQSNKVDALADLILKAPPPTAPEGILDTKHCIDHNINKKLSGFRNCNRINLNSNRDDRIKVTTHPVGVLASFAMILLDLKIIYESIETESVSLPYNYMVNIASVDRIFSSYETISCSQYLIDILNRFSILIDVYSLWKRSAEPNHTQTSAVQTKIKNITKEIYNTIEAKGKLVDSKFSMPLTPPYNNNASTAGNNGSGTTNGGYWDWLLSFFRGT